MTPENFCYWLQGYTELNGDPPTPEQWQSIKEHLKLVFDKITPEVLHLEKVTLEGLREHMEKTHVQFLKDAPEWQKDLLKQQINPNLTIEC